MHDGFTAVMLGGSVFIPGSYSASDGINGGVPGFGLLRWHAKPAKNSSR